MLTEVVREQKKHAYQVRLKEMATPASVGYMNISRCHSVAIVHSSALAASKVRRRLLSAEVHELPVFGALAADFGC